MNNFKAWLLMGLISGLFVLMGSFLGGRSGALLFFLISLAINFFSFYYSDKIAIKMTGSYPVERHEAPELYEMVERLCRKADMPLPQLYIQPTEQPNAFATGRSPNHAAVAVTEGLLRGLSRDELEGVIAHELAHIKNRDVLVGTIAASMAGAVTMIADMLSFSAFFGSGDEDEDGGGSAIVMAFLAPIAAMIIQMAISRQREYLADETGARITGNPQGLANALLRIEGLSMQAMPMAVNPAASHMYIANPLSGSSLANLFSTHPPIPERVQRLTALRVG
ncbi:M48 family metalloprotease [Heliobacterium gestii]|uniref:Protease HtpX homolog n=1 Tax=Heliomicrobium gestii TaxID=2699 RepID=A0A845L4E9_HELGE|nr:zinc metalloprotease HtpX [Heliomicrobium gestii]MBM7865183.1 heat shock protein HtpX [Heliomicrobium gestii]MZP41452.1 M48 family metalloprotease [Heliomicrobium gestii]